MPAAAEWFVALLLLITGVSHVLRPRAWADFFVALFAQPQAGFIIGVPALLVGLFVLTAHPAWTPDTRSIVTLVGWAWSIKGTLYLLFPALPVRVGAPHMKRPAHFALAGLLLAGVAGVLLAGLVSRA
jgi:uncharacterized protein YjeT (DUF2065 family)